MRTQETTGKTLSVKLDNAMRDRIKNLADIQQRTTHWVMRQAITQYVEREEKREAFRQATLAAWQEYQETGLHVTGDEADNWLAELGEGQDVAPPQWHR
ncbi:MAG: ribbon-helix-helix protein, CopG family [Zoogloeaceae bacterium]|jgi:predicted transcriptional regulator|nr:ribbon-helix-helix protein, CopG family [Zoogloeaceae bacterium]